MVNAINELDKFEMYNIQQTLSMIDKRGFAQVMERERVRKRLESPYFGRFDFVYQGDDLNDAQIFYIGRFGFADGAGNQLIYDWRAPVSNMYYEFEIGKARYMAMERLFEGEIVRKRQINIKNSKLLYVLESSLTILDEVLQQTLSQNTSEKMRSIVTTIQREQNRIIRNERAYHVIVQVGRVGKNRCRTASHRLFLV
mgnify:CR=1 FL=1